MTEQISINDFLSLSPQWLRALEKKGFKRKPELEKISPTIATLVYSGEYVAFVFSYDIRDQCLDVEVVKVKNEKLVYNWEGGYSSNLFMHLVKHEKYRGGPKGTNWSNSLNATKSTLEQVIKGWLNLLETAGDKVLQDNIDSLP